MVDSNFRVFYEHDQNESKHYLSLMTHGAGPLAEDGRWVLIGKVGAAVPEGEAQMAEAEQVFDGFDQGDDWSIHDHLPQPAAEGFVDGLAEGFQGEGSEEAEAVAVLLQVRDGMGDNISVQVSVRPVSQ